MNIDLRFRQTRSHEHKSMPAEDKLSEKGKGDTHAAAAEKPWKSTWKSFGGEFGLRKVARETLDDRVYSELKRAIMYGDITPGDRLSMRDLSRSIGTSMMPVRHAVQRLSAEGTLEMLPNRSFALPVLAADTFRQVLDVRLLLEGDAAERAAGSLTDEEIAQIEGLERIMESWQDISLTTYLDVHQRFHFSIYVGARSDVLLSLLDSLWIQVRPCLLQIMSDSQYEVCDTYHRTVLDALMERNGAAARAAIENDILHAGENILKLMLRDPVSD